MPCIDLKKRNTRDWIDTNIVLRRYFPVDLSIRITDIVIDKNNGNHLSLDQNSKPSEMFNKLVNMLGVDMAHIIRSGMFSDSLMNKIGDWRKNPSAISLAWKLPTSNKTYDGVSLSMFYNKTVSNYDLSESELNKENEEMNKCLGYAELGARSKLKRGEMWQLIRDVKGPSHKAGGVDLNVSSFSRNGKKIKAEEGLFVADTENLSMTSIANVDGMMQNYTDFLDVSSSKKQTVESGFDVSENASVATSKPVPEVKQEYKINNTNEVTPSSLSYQSNLDKKAEGYLGTCNTQHCSAYIQKVAYKNTSHPYKSFAEFRAETGMHGDAWNLPANILEQGGSRLTIEESAPGDVIAISTKNSSYRNEAFKEGAGNTHIALVERVDPNGVVWVRHNAHMKNPNWMEGNGEPKYLGREYVERIDPETLKIGNRENMIAGYAYRPNINNESE